MDPERWLRSRRIFVGALDRDPPHRSAYLDEACGSDAALPREVEALLAACSEDDGFLERPAYREMPGLLREYVPGHTIAQENPGVPPELARIIRRCLRRDPAQRYGSARALPADSERIAAPFPLASAPGRVAGKTPAGRGHGLHRAGGGSSIRRAPDSATTARSSPCGWPDNGRRDAKEP